MTSRAGEGSTFTVGVPFGSAHLPGRAASRRAARSVAAAAAVRRASSPRRTRWSVPDDSTPARRPRPPPAPGPGAGRRRQRRHPRATSPSCCADDYHVQTAVDGAGGLEQARRQPPDLVLTDVMMPRLGRLRAARGAAADPVTVRRAGRDALGPGRRGGDRPGPRRRRRRLPRQALHGPRAAGARPRQPRLDRAPPDPRRSSSAAGRLLDQAQRLARVGSWEIDLATGTIAAPRSSCGSAADRRRGRDDHGSRTLPAAVHPDDRGAWCELALDAAPDDDRLRLRDPRRAAGRRHRARVRRAARSSSTSTAGARAARLACRTSPSGARAEEALALAAANAEAAAGSTASPTSSSAACCRSALRPRAPRGRDLLPRRRRGHPGRRRLVRRDRARRRPHGTRGRRRDGPRCARGGGDGPAALGGPRLRPARPAAGRPPGVPRRPGAGPRRGPDRHLHLRGVRPRRPRAPLRQRRPPPADRRATRRGVPRRGRRREPAARRGSLQPHPARASTSTSNARVVLYTDGLVERRGEDLDAGHRDAGQARRRRWSARSTGRPEELVAAMLPDGPDDDVAILVARIDPRRGEESLSREIVSTRRRWRRRGTSSRRTSGRGGCPPRWSPTPPWRPASW